MTSELIAGDIKAVQNWLRDLDGLDFDEIAADGGVTVGMVVQQQAREMAARMARAIDELSRRPQEVGDREQIAGAVERIRATASEARQLAASLDAKPAIAKEIDPGIQRSAYLMAAKHDWLMDAVKEIEAAISTRAPSVGEGETAAGDREQGERAPAAGRPEVPAVQRIECVSYESGFREPAEPVWRVRVGEYCADFETETAANNFHDAILALSQPRPEGEMREGSEHGALLERAKADSRYAPGTLIYQLADTIEALVRERDEANAHFDVERNSHDRTIAERDALRSQLARAETALRDIEKRVGRSSWGMGTDIYGTIRSYFASLSPVDGGDEPATASSEAGVRDD